VVQKRRCLWVQTESSVQGETRSSDTRVQKSFADQPFFDPKKTHAYLDEVAEIAS
jgi:hypothetical protein